MTFLPRRHFLAISGLNENLFKTLARRHQVPRVNASTRDLGIGLTDDERNQYEAARDASGYLPVEAIMAATADGFVSSASMDRDVAKAFIEGNPQAMREAIEIFERGEDVWLAAYTDVDIGNDEPLAAVPFAKAGGLAKITSEITNGWKDDNREGRTLALLNLTPILRRARKAADDLGLNGSFLAR
ncbi:hypothetical protein [Paracoccus saliphilus]|uniref:Uncharacterized protein n=1 Tax=Paracoccus saliphilus TaxID=405559 RepID=A0AA46A4Z8_9RHOB|nr:hypothetical protein [Paracoccus saliphilus]WCR04996.1 hypothetical protein JHX88_09940 [Paracoccus saliphilus]SIS71554.1 hypothetical protein SAMN05421772_103214 [Paracoccus saliphilus]